MKTLIFIVALSLLILTPAFTQDTPPTPTPPPATDQPSQTSPQEPPASDEPTIPPETNTTTTQEVQPIPPSQMTPEQARAELRQMILDNPESLALIHRAGFQISDILDTKWQMSPLKSKRLIRIDRALQRIFAFENGIPKYIFICSTCANKVVIPVGGKGPKIHEHVGNFKVLSKEEVHYSKEYHVPMPHAVRYVQGHFMHETTHLGQLGRPASGGCARMNHHGAITIYNFAHIKDPVEER